MYIYEAVKKALQEHCGIRRTKKPEIILIPTHERVPIDVMMERKENRRIPNWNPTPEELMSDDWEVTKLPQEN